MFRVSAPTRISLTLACLCLTLLFAAQTLGLIPDPSRAVLDGRKSFCKAVATQARWAVQSDDLKTLKTETAKLLDRNENVLSAAIRRANGQYVARIRNHPSRWQTDETQKGAADHVEIPIHKGRTVWGRIEISFRPLSRQGWAWWFTAPVRLIICLTLSTFLLTRLYLKRILRQLDPSSVVPERVRSTLDTLAEGVLIVDTRQQIVLANKAFADKAGRTVEELQGMPVANLHWNKPDKETPFPWESAIHSNAPQTGALLTMHSTPHHKRSFVVNATPILGPDGQPRGAMATFDDVTSIEEKNLQLEEMLQSLKMSWEEVRQKNKELKLLAARDPLTGCLNRRALFDAFVIEWQAAAAQGSSLSCIMIDIDHFKLINDQFGHTVGDEVLQKVSSAIREGVRESDLVGRYGGEEFCLLLPSTPLRAAGMLAEKLRARVAQTTCNGRAVTASFGVSSSERGASHPQELLEQADRAMYLSKRRGRDCVTSWSDSDAEQADSAGVESVARPSASSLNTAIPIQAVNALMAALIFRDPITAEHSRRVADLCVLAARGRMSEEQCYVLEVAGLLHDIGKLGVPDSILLKPGSLTPEETRIMNTHDRIGVEILRDAFALEELSLLVGNSHAWYGGSPHDPTLPTGKDIPLGARLLMITDAYDAMTSDRIYRKALSQQDAFAELRRGAGVQFDPDLVEQFIETISAHAPPDSQRSGSSQMALAMGIQAERIAIALENRDFASLITMAGQLLTTTREKCWQPVTRLAAQLQEAAAKDPDIFQLVSLTTELLKICNTSQETCLANERFVEAPGLSLVDAPSPAADSPTPV